MYTLFRPNARVVRVGSLLPPERPYLAGTMSSLVNDVMAYYHHAPKRVSSDHLFCRLLSHLPAKWDMDDRRYLNFIDGVASTWSRPLGIVSPTTKGKIHEQGITLGRQCHEVLMEHHDGIPGDIEDVGAWRFWQPFRYLSHTRYDLQLPVLNNQLDVRGYGAGIVDIPLLALQFRRWQQSLKKRLDQREAIFRFVGGYVLPNAVPSYVDIAVFNRLTRLNNQLPLKNHPSPHPFYLTDLSQRVDQFCRRVIEDNPRRRTDLSTFVATTPLLLTPSLLTLVQRLPRMPVTHQNEWAIAFSRLPYLQYIVEHGCDVDRSAGPEALDLYESLRESRFDRIFRGVAASQTVALYEDRFNQLEVMLMEKGIGQG